MRVRRSVAADASPIATLEEVVFGPEAWSLDALHSELGCDAGAGWVAAVAEELAGYVLTTATDDLVEVRRIGVAPSNQRQGVARTLLTAAVDAARADGARAVLLEVSASNAPALALYAAEGFTEISSRRRYYRDGSDALVLRRWLTDDARG